MYVYLALKEKKVVEWFVFEEGDLSPTDVRGKAAFDFDLGTCDEFLVVEVDKKLGRNLLAFDDPETDMLREMSYFLSDLLKLAFAAGSDPKTVTRRFPSGK